MSPISLMLTYVIDEGSTIVMKAILGNSYKLLIEAVGNAPRGERTHPVRHLVHLPLMWTIETGSMESVRALNTDRLTIRADRCYYRIVTLFERHPESS